MGDTTEIIVKEDAEIVAKPEHNDDKIEQIVDDKKIEKIEKIVDGNGEELSEIKVEKTTASSRNSSDIFSLKQAKPQTRSELFSFRGVPTKLRTQEQQQQQQKEQQPDNASLSSNISTSSKMSRNPVTGNGVCSNDEFNTKPNNRKDGNPVLGVGYTEDNKKDTHPTRIPPGGYSHGLW